MAKPRMCHPPPIKFQKPSSYRFIVYFPLFSISLHFLSEVAIADEEGRELGMSQAAGQMGTLRCKFQRGHVWQNSGACYQWF